MDPAKIARRLISFVAEAQPVDLEVKEFPPSVSQERRGLSEFGIRERYRRPAQIMIEELREALADADWNPNLSDIPSGDRDCWLLGEAMILRRPARDILRGFLVPQRKVPILQRVPDNVALFLITIDNGKDYLKRETHGMGLHYHYLNWRKERSNVVLSWDTRWTEPKPQTTPPTLRALFVEPHGEKKNADFEAKPWLWGDKKRKSIYEACAPDLKTWPINEFKCAADKSEVVHPPGRALTLHPTSLAASAQKGAASTRKIKKRRR